MGFTAFKKKEKAPGNKSKPGNTNLLKKSKISTKQMLGFALMVTGLVLIAAGVLFW